MEHECFMKKVFDTYLEVERRRNNPTERREFFGVLTSGIMMHPNLSPMARLIAAYLCARWREGEKEAPPMGEIGHEFNLSIRQTIKYLEELVGEGIVDNPDPTTTTYLLKDHDAYRRPKERNYRINPLEEIEEF